MKALVTGITGQAGHYLTKLLLEQDFEVYGIKRRSSTETTGRIKKFLNDIEIIEGDITDPVSVNSFVGKVRPDIIFNAASQSHVASSFTQPSYTFNATGLGVINMLEAVKNYSPLSRFIQYSSSEMFGKSYDIKKSIFPGGNYKYQNEDTVMTPQSPYAIAKLMGHHAVRLYRESYGLFACSMICFNWESPHRGEQFVTRKITKWVANCRKWLNLNFGEVTFDDDYLICGNKKFPKLRLGNLKAMRDWSHAEDTTRAIYLASIHERPDDYVISSGETHSVEEFLNLAFKYAGINDDPMKYVVIDPKFYRPAEVDYLLGDSSKIRRVLGWVPKYSFDQLVKDMVDSDINGSML